MLRNSLYQQIRSQSRQISTSSSVLAKRPSAFKRLIVDKPYEPKHSTDLKSNATNTSQRIKKDGKTTKPRPDQEKRESTLPVLESFTPQQLKKSANLVEKITSFSELKLLPEVRSTIISQLKSQTVLRSKNYEVPKYENIDDIPINPTPVQTVAIHTMTKNLTDPVLKTYTIAAETGSGKTWAYISPMLDYLKQQETLIGEENWERIKGKSMIRAVVMVPTLELVQQVYDNVKGVHSELGLNLFKWDTDTEYSQFIDAFRNRIDILITTPGKINSIRNIRMISRPEHVLANVKFLVIDEADTLMDRSFVESTYEAITRMPHVQRLVFCTATISTQLNKAIDKIFPNTKPELILSPTLHTPPKGIKFKMIDSEIAPYQGSKSKALAQILYAIAKDGTETNYEKRCVVFVNLKSDVKAVEESLKEYGHDVVTLTGEDNPAERTEKIQVFINPPKELSMAEPQLKKKKQQQPTQTKVKEIPLSNIVLETNPKPQSSTVKTSNNSLKVLVTTDIAARGLNFFSVRNVILYDSPKTAVDFIHRIGRTGRMNQAGRVFVISDRHSKSWVKRFVGARKNSGSKEKRS
ncbi:hypothetical protein WICPIJ_007558 [Wickerhamomyces pijperi]|uniref:RNA helicase n=1 Tax=Wickerhamomyces pijperi TaxID=599730 RepID=A0A9P8Q2B1_WICPI|nr:hypothetical protein WICPIJ_007558 [Wickerhamomyces pijperi]